MKTERLRGQSAWKSWAATSVMVAICLLFPSGCAGPGRPTGRFDVTVREAPPAASADQTPTSYRVFFVKAGNEDRSGMTDKELRDQRGLEATCEAITYELRERGFLVTQNPRAADIDAYVHFGYGTRRRGGN